MEKTVMLSPAKFFLWLLTLPALILATTPLFAQQIPAGFGTQPIFNQTFPGNTLNTAIWTYRGVDAQRDDCYLTRKAVEVGHGFLRIRTYTAKDASGATKNYCGAITTEGGSFLHSYGYWVASLRFHYEQGMQCAFWIQSPHIGEFINDPKKSGTEMDIFEHVHFKKGQSAYDHAVIWNGYGKYSRDVPFFSHRKELTDGKFHTFGLAWTPEHLDFYVDGKLDWHLTASDAAISGIAEYLILDTELPSASVVPKAGYGPEGAASNPYLDVNYVRVYPYIGPAGKNSHQ